MRSKVSGALTYPIIMVVLGTIIMGVLMVVVVPKITSIFQDMGKTLPWNTQLLIFMSDLIGSYWWALIALFGFSYWLYRRWSRKPKGRAVVDRVKLKLPLIGPLVRFVGVARFARTLATMLAAGVPVLAALEITKKVLNNTVLEKVVEEARDAIREGESIATPLKRSGQFPSLMVHMVAVGERSGQLEAMLENVATAYERDVEAKVSRLTTILSPHADRLHGAGRGVHRVLGSSTHHGHAELRAVRRIQMSASEENSKRIARTSGARCRSGLHAARDHGRVGHHRAAGRRRRGGGVSRTSRRRRSRRRGCA